MPKRTISKAKAQKIFVGTMAGAMALTLGVASRGFFQGSSAEAPKPVPAKRLPFFKVGKELKVLVDDSRQFGEIKGDD